jgi:hypothetical protein
VKYLSLNDNLERLIKTSSGSEQSNKQEHALRDKTIVKAVISGNEIITISLEEIEVDLKVRVAHLNQLSHVINQVFVLNGLQLLHVVKFVNISLN